MKTHIKVNASAIPSLNFKGIEVSEITESSGGDMRGIELRDTVTGTSLIIRSGSSYSEFTAYTNKQPKKVTKYKVDGKLGDGVVSATFDDKTKAEEYISTNENIKDAVITEIIVEVFE